MTCRRKIPRVQISADDPHCQLQGLHRIVTRALIALLDIDLEH
jgi:hypothetical protein